jgi:hypothetical protein
MVPTIQDEEGASRSTDMARVLLRLAASCTGEPRTLSSGGKLPMDVSP